MKIDCIEKYNLTKQLERAEEEINTTKQMIILVCNFLIYGFVFFSFDIIQTYAWYGFHRANPIITQQMLNHQALLYCFTIFTAVTLWMLWLERCCAPISDDAEEGFRKIDIWIKGAIAGGKKAVRGEL